LSTHTISNYFIYIRANLLRNEFPLPPGWALKENQKYGKKGSGKRIAKQIVEILQSLFLAGNANKSERSSAKDMLNILIEMADRGEIDHEKIPKEVTIQNWISRYAAALRKASAEQALQEAASM
jgi:hypothetical protein